jgi:hypothetical protein
MSKEQQLAGITPYVLRLSAYYAALGVGTYRPKGYAQFDRVEVRVKQPWQPGQLFTESCLILVVEFFSYDALQRYVEFALTPAGFSGKPVVQLVPAPDVEPPAPQLTAYELGHPLEEMKKEKDDDASP